MSEVPDAARDAIGRVTVAEDEITAAPVAAMMATFGRAGPSPRTGDALPPLWHGLFCTAKLPPDRLAEDGLAKDEPLLPALPDFPNRLFGGARFTFSRPLRIGQTIRRESVMAEVDAKSGRSGDFLVARVEHRVVGPDGLSVLEENDIIFRPAVAAGTGGGTAGAAASPPPPFGDTAWRRAIDPDPVLMFRHAALTFNAHRIHYDRDYTRAIGFPGLLVQGTLIARLMLELLHDKMPAAALAAFAFRSGAPLFDTGPFALEALPTADGASVSFRAVGAEGQIGMTAIATIRPD